MKKFIYNIIDHPKLSEFVLLESVNKQLAATFEMFMVMAKNLLDIRNEIPLLYGGSDLFSYYKLNKGKTALFHMLYAHILYNMNSAIKLNADMIECNLGMISDEGFDVRIQGSDGNTQIHTLIYSYKLHTISEEVAPRNPYFKTIDARIKDHNRKTINLYANMDRNFGATWASMIQDLLFVYFHDMDCRCDNDKFNEYADPSDYDPYEFSYKYVDTDELTKDDILMKSNLNADKIKERYTYRNCKTYNCEAYNKILTMFNLNIFSCNFPESYMKYHIDRYLKYLISDCDKTINDALIYKFNFVALMGGLDIIRGKSFRSSSYVRDGDIVLTLGPAYYSYAKFLDDESSGEVNPCTCLLNLPYPCTDNCIIKIIDKYCHPSAKKIQYSYITYI